MYSPQNSTPELGAVIQNNLSQIVLLKLLYAICFITILLVPDCKIISILEWLQAQEDMSLKRELLLGLVFVSIRYISFEIF